MRPSETAEGSWCSTRPPMMRAGPSADSPSKSAGRTITRTRNRPPETTVAQSTARQKEGLPLSDEAMSAPGVLFGGTGACAGRGRPAWLLIAARRKPGSRQDSPLRDRNDYPAPTLHALRRLPQLVAPGHGAGGVGDPLAPRAGVEAGAGEAGEGHGGRLVGRRHAPAAGVGGAVRR